MPPRARIIGAFLIKKNGVELSEKQKRSKLQIDQTAKAFNDATGSQILRT